MAAILPAISLEHHIPRHRCRFDGRSLLARLPVRDSCTLAFRWRRPVFCERLIRGPQQVRDTEIRDESVPGAQEGHSRVWMSRLHEPEPVAHA
jgi:hypothetical protein